jgi:hypothetical protein
MSHTDPIPELDPNFSDSGTTPRPWSEARSRLEEAEIFWVASVRPDGRPHVTPVAAVMIDDAVVFGTGPTERKAQNLTGNPKCIVMTGTNRLGEGFDIVVEGEAVKVTEAKELRPIADAFEAKYPGVMQYEIRDDGSVGNADFAGGEALLFRVAPDKALGFWRADDGFSQTRWRFTQR